MSHTLRFFLPAAALIVALAACTPFEPPVRALNDAGFWEISLEDGDLVLQWNVEAPDLHIIVTAPTDGFIGVGFDPTTRMLGANILIGWVDDDDLETHVRDDYGNTSTSHKPDVEDGGESNVSAVSGTQVDGVTTLDFTIPLESGDSHDKVLVEGETHRFMLSYGASDDLTVKHIARYSFDMEL